MKKRIFSLMAVVLFVGSTLNVNAISNADISEDVFLTCFEWADSTATINGFEQGWTHEQEYHVFVYLYEKCLNQ
ncbi:hypothetical protein [Winogradskyella vidalii]|uniref:hypothetical protein n=1 Tax=Winogradskyella vidalii TaxID=2615024 RepID=UPI0015CBDEB1|nr:hypothetical protein [Winogradskyella vidalii]